MLLVNLKVILEKHGKTSNELTSRRTNNTTVKEFKSNGSIISNSSELSNAFNDHFSTTGPRPANEIPPNDNNNDLSYINNINVNHNKFSFSSTSSSIVLSRLNKLCRSKDVHNQFQFLYVISKSLHSGI